MPLYKCKVTIAVMLEAADGEEARERAETAASKELMQTGADLVRVIPATDASRIPESWRSAVPWFHDGNTTCGQWFDHQEMG